MTTHLVSSTEDGTVVCGALPPAKPSRETPGLHSTDDRSLVTCSDCLARRAEARDIPAGRSGAFNLGDPMTSPARPTSCDPLAYEGDTTGYAAHLTMIHGVPDEQVAPYRHGLDQGSWLALNRIHSEILGGVSEILADYDPTLSLVVRGVMVDPAEHEPHRPVFDISFVELQTREQGTPFTDTEGNQWLRVVFGTDGVCAAEDTDHELHVWDSRQLFEAVFRTMRHDHTDDEETP